MDDETLTQLTAQCTCPECGELYTRPLRLPCRHTVCSDCFTGMRSKMTERRRRTGVLWLISDKGVRCPACRKPVPDDYLPQEDEETEQLGKQLRQMQAALLCGTDGCESLATVPCPCGCDRHLCDEHQRTKRDSLRYQAIKLHEDVRTFLEQETSVDSSAELTNQTRQLEAHRESIPLLRRRLEAKLRSQLDAYEQQVMQAMQALQGLHSDDNMLQALRAESEWMDKLLQQDDYNRYGGMINPQSERLLQARRDCPPWLVGKDFDPDRLEGEFEEFLSRISTHAYVRPYDQLDGTLRPRLVKSTDSKHASDIDLLTNLDGVVVINGSLALRSDRPRGGAEIKGPCLLVNYQNFPTGKLHVMDMEVNEVATVDLQLKNVGMTGRFCVCNERQLICASDAGRHKVMICRLDGSLLRQFGSHGASDNELDAPLGLRLRDSILYVADSDNRRVQLYDADDDFRCVASLRHEKFTTNVCAIVVTDSVIGVLDRNCKSLFIFDKASRSFKRQQQLAGPAFDATADKFGNIFVSLAEEGRVQIFSPQASVCLNMISFASDANESRMKVLTRFEEGRPHRGVLEMLADADESEQQSISANGLAINAAAGRLFVGDRQRLRILAFDL